MENYVKRYVTATVDDKVMYVLNAASNEQAVHCPAAASVSICPVPSLPLGDPEWRRGTDTPSSGPRLALQCPVVADLHRLSMTSSHNKRNIYTFCSQSACSALRMFGRGRDRRSGNTRPWT